MDPEIKLEDQMSQEELTALTESEDFMTNFKPEDFEDPDKTEELRQRLQDAKTTIHQKRHYRDKVKELSDKLTEKDKKIPGEGEGEKPQPKVEKKDDKDDGATDKLVALEFRQDHPELTKEQVKEILEYAEAKKISPDEAFKKPLIKQFLKETNDKEEVEDASITPSKKGSSGAGSKDWSNASKEDIEKQRNKVMFGS